MSSIQILYQDVATEIFSLFHDITYLQIWIEGDPGFLKLMSYPHDHRGTLQYFSLTVSLNSSPKAFIKLSKPRFSDSNPKSAPILGESQITLRKLKESSKPSPVKNNYPNASFRPGMHSSIHFVRFPVSISMKFSHPEKNFIFFVLS